MAVPELELTQEEVDERTHVIALRGELDVATVGALAEPLREVIAAGKRAIVIDLSELTFLDSTGLMVLLNGLRRIVGQGGRLAIVCANPTVLRLFEITGTTSTFTILPSRAAALAHVRDQEPSDSV